MSKNEINLQNACFCVCKMQQYSAGCSSYNEVMILPEFCLLGPVLPTCLKKKTEYLGYNTYKPILSIPVLMKIICLEFIWIKMSSYLNST